MDTLAALDLPFDEAIAFLRNKANVTSEGWEDVWQKANAKSFTVAGATTEALVRDFRDEVAKALESGSSIQAFRQTFDRIVKKHGWKHVGKPGWRSAIIFETNLSMAYAAGRYRQMTEPVTLQAFPYWQYVHSGAKHYRPQHKAWNGLTLRADDPFWSWAYPPNGWRCGCRVRPLTAEGLKRSGRKGPDTAPEREFTGYTVKRTGEIKRATVGIDPGFDYNVGEAWLEGPAGQVGKPGPTPESRRSRPRASAYLAPAEIADFARRALAGALDRFATTTVIDTPAEIAAALGIEAGMIEISAFRVLKVAGRAAEAGGLDSTEHPEIGPAEWALLPDIVLNGEAHAASDRLGRPVVMLHRRVDERTLFAVLRAVKTETRGTVVIVPTFSQSGKRRRHRVLAGAVRIREEKG